MKNLELSSILLMLLWIISIHAISNKTTQLSAIDGLTTESSSKSLNYSVCNLHLCQSSEEDEFLFCSCDKDCFRDGSCCLGLYSEEEEEADIREKDFYEIYQHEDFYNGKFIKVVGRCPSNATNETEVEECHNSVSNISDPLMMFPMISVNTSIVYKNWACGKCNEGTDTQFQLEFTCLEGSNLPKTIEEGSHLYLSNRSCLPTIPSHANLYINNYNFYVSNETIIHCPSFHNNDLTKWRCSTYLAPFTFDGRRYKNAFCAECNGVIVKQEDVICRRSIFPTKDTYTFQIDANFSIGGEFPFSDIQSRCTAGSVYDPYQQQCRLLYSSSSTFFEDEVILNATNNSDINSNALKSVIVPNCFYQIYNQTEYERSDWSKILIKATNATYKAGEYRTLPLDEKLEVCVKEKDDSLPLCIDHFCPNNYSNSFRSCSCNSNCFEKSDCCLDALTHKEFSSLREKVFLSCIRLSSGKTVFAINQCPKNYRNSSIRSSCESLSYNDPFLETPVYSNLTNITYKNIFCGICHDAKDLLFFPFEISCDDLWNSRTAVTAFGWTKGDNSKCTLSYRIPFSIISPCEDDMEYKCSKEWELSADALKKDVNSMCRTIKAPITVKINETVKDYRNIYCAQCNGVDPYSSNVVVDCFFRTAIPLSGPSPTARPRHLGVLFTVG